MPFARIHYFYTARNGLEGVAGNGPKKLTLRKRQLVVIEKYVEDVKQDEKSVPNLVESMIRSTDLAKEELRRILFKMSQCSPKIKELRVCTFWMSGKITDSRRRLPAGAK